VDQLERTLYNSLLAGISLDGKLMFDADPLESLGRNQRRAWPTPVPANVAAAQALAANVNAAAGINAVRVLAALPSYIYATQGDTIYVNLFVASTATVKLANGRTVKIQ